MDIEALLTPISEAEPCGKDFSFSSEFDVIAELRREDDATLDQGAWVTALKVADWSGVEALCSELLAARTKDLRLAMWFAEAAAINRGYVGLQQGVDLCTHLCERYWADIHPRTEDGDLEERVGNISWLLHRLVGLATAAPITRGKAGNFSLAQMHAARALQPMLDRAPEKSAQLAESTVTLEKFNRALKETPKQVLLETLSALQSCQNSLRAWQEIIDAQLGAEGPSFVAAREALAAALHDAQRLAREAGALHTAAASAELAAPSEQQNAPRAIDQTAAGGPLVSREQALMQLREVAAFFRATEPHSPVAYLAEKAVHWGDMPLHEWLRAVVKEAGTLAHLQELLGVADQPGGASASGA